jgi:hypothetical protein
LKKVWEKESPNKYMCLYLSRNKKTIKHPIIKKIDNVFNFKAFKNPEAIESKKILDKKIYFKFFTEKYKNEVFYCLKIAYFSIDLYIFNKPK